VTPADGPRIVFLTGASGSGKTSVVRALHAMDPAGVHLHFDRIGVPDRETMIREFGSGERWQQEMTRRWVARIVTDHPREALVFFEGQVRPSFILGALEEHRVARGEIILIHCADEEREARLRGRGQPDLANAEMRSWSAFLLQDAKARGLHVVDTTGVSVVDAAAAVSRIAGSALPG
jgi:dephospho-CoA kinase